ncbi:MAG TPA: ABC transporter ATP-binding protein [Actinomycetota bacterium]|nr:ABC transporter ATP-binding protein [Actinomycetota bacterium]
MGMRLLDEKVPLGDEARATVRGLWMVAAAAPAYFLAILASTTVSGILPAVVVAQTGRFLSVIPEAIAGGAGSPAAGTARDALILIGAAIVGTQVLGPLQGAALFGVQRRFQAHLSRRIMRSLTELPGLAHHEDPAFRDKLEVSQWVQWAPVNSLNFLTHTLQMTAQLFGMAAVAATYARWVPPAVFALALPEAVAAWKLVATVSWWRMRRSDEARRASYFRRLALTLEPAKELRVFGMQGWIQDRQATHWLAGIREVWRERRRGLLIRMGLHAVALAGLAWVYLDMVGAAIAGRIDIGVFAAASMGVIGMMSALLAVSQSAAQLRQANYYLPTALQLIDLPRRDPRMEASGVRSARELDRTGITFEDVSFVYPGTERVILDGLNLHIPAGSSVALVGENGAGKTTLIKLLSRFYDPTSGRILLDGVDIQELDIVSLRSRLAVIFQDFARYFLSARDNVGFGAVSRSDDLELVREAAGRVGVVERIESLEQGWETPLSREFGGTDLSGGEWQRIALARAMMAQVAGDADLLILDEPTASLDVRLEHELYTHFAEMTKGRTTLLVSHRFSTVRMADRIVFLEDGRVVEDGTHEQLMERGGRYAELYEMQASHYRATGSLD